MEKKESKRLRVAVIGCGRITEERHAPEYAACDGCEVAGFYDFVPARAEALAARYGGVAYPTAEALLADPTVDAVSICTQNSTHADLTVAALRAGKHVLCEKPMASTLEECERMVKEAEATGLRLAIAHNQRLMPAHKEAHRLLSEGAIGRVLTFATRFGHSGPDNWSVDRGTGNWFFDKARSSFGAVADLGIHKLDLVRYLLDDDVADVQAVMGTLDKRDAAGNLVSVDDNAVILCRMRGGAVGTVTASWTYYAEEENDTTVYGTEGRMDISPAKGLVTVTRAGGESVTYSAPAEATSGVIDAFVTAVREGIPSVIDVEATFPSMRAMLFAIAAADNGTRVNL